MKPLLRNLSALAVLFAVFFCVAAPAAADTVFSDPPALESFDLDHADDIDTNGDLGAAVAGVLSDWRSSAPIAVRWESDFRATSGQRFDACMHYRVQRPPDRL